MASLCCYIIVLSHAISKLFHSSMFHAISAPRPLFSSRFLFLLACASDPRFLFLFVLLGVSSSGLCSFLGFFGASAPSSSRSRFAWIDACSFCFNSSLCMLNVNVFFLVSISVTRAVTFCPTSTTSLTSFTKSSLRRLMWHKPCE